MSTPSTPRSLSPGLALAAEECGDGDEDGPCQCYAAVTLRALSGEFIATTEYHLDGAPVEPNLGEIVEWARKVKRVPKVARIDVIIGSGEGRPVSRRPVSCRHRPFARIREFLSHQPDWLRRDPEDATGLSSIPCFGLTATLIELAAGTALTRTEETVEKYQMNLAEQFFAQTYATDPF